MTSKTNNIMKKTMFAAVAALVMTGGVMAQNVVHSYVPPSNYFQAWTWPDFSDTIGYVENCAGGTAQDQEAYRILIEGDTLTVYGIAASMSTMALRYPKQWGDIVNDFIDTTYNEVWDLLRLYVNEGDSNLRQIGNDLKVHIKTTPISYYLDMGFHSQELPPQYYEPFPFYERYFDAPVTVTDSFYIGRYFHAHRFLYSGLHNTRSIILFNLMDYHTYIPIRMAEHWDPSGTNMTDTTRFKWCFMEPENCWSDEYPLIFPILTPNPDTTDNGRDTIVGGDTTRVDPDTLGIQSVELLKRYTSVQPNPATETAKVISSFGLTRIEAFNSAGDRVYDAPHTGLTATLDVSRWPAGTYILRLHTPAGTVGKKILVRPVGQ